MCFFVLTSFFYSNIKTTKDNPETVKRILLDENLKFFKVPCIIAKVEKSRCKQKDACI
ncbi:hypothetical protein FORC47_0102 [Bacillus cereus]|nr:hypothetical protein FORC47_0102 [Bacillus cereus]